MAVLWRIVSGVTLLRFNCDNFALTFRLFSMSRSNAKIVGTAEYKRGGNLAGRIRKALASENRHHPTCKFMEVEKQRIQPRFKQDIEKHWFIFFNSLQSMPQYAKYFEVWSAVPLSLSPVELFDVVSHMDIYEASTFLRQQNFAKHPSFTRHALAELYTNLWLRSVNVERPTDLKIVLINISTWIRIGIFPCNLFSEAFRLLPGSISPEIVILCVLYRGFATKLSLPTDDDIFPIAEELLLDEMPSLSMTELYAISVGYFMSYRPFSGKPGMLLTHLLMKRFFDLLPEEQYNSQCQSVLKIMKLNYHWNLTDMKRFLPVLETSGFFEYCEKATKYEALHQLQLVMAFVNSRQFVHDELLLKCVETFKCIIKRDDGALRSKDVAHAWSSLLNLGVIPDSEMIDFAISFFTNAVREGEFGLTILMFLTTCGTVGIFPLELIDAYFSSEALMRLENGKLPGMNGHGHDDPFKEILRFDTALGIMCPEYKGARLPEEIKQIALALHVEMAKKDMSVILREYFLLAEGLDKFFNKKRVKNAKKYASVEIPVPTVQRLLLLDLDRTNKPIPRDQIWSGASGSRKIAIYIPKKGHLLRNTDGDLIELTNHGKFLIALMEKLGYEVILVERSDSTMFGNDQYLKWFAERLGQQLQKKKP